MASNRRLFLQHLALTSDAPYLVEIERAEGIHLYGPDGKAYVDLVSGVSVSNLGHGNPAILEAIRKQADKYLHLHVYGEFIQEPQVRLAAALADILPERLSSTYFVNSGSEAVEGALKLARRHTGRHRVIAFRNAYHGSTMGALAVMGGEGFKNAFRPLPPGTTLIDFNDFRALDEIDRSVAAVIMEPIQGEAGIILPEKGFLEKVRDKCDASGTLLIFDEVQTAFGRTGKLFAFEHRNVVPDVLVLAKALGGGMPLGAFIAPGEIMRSLRSNPPLGHITTFGGHPVSCAAGLAALRELIAGDWLGRVDEKEKLFREHLVHPSVVEIRGTGLYLAVELGETERLARFLRLALEEGIVTDSFLFRESAFRVSPPLTITAGQITETCNRIRGLLDRL
jgi:acetylornithine/N-succinyldiaminopimelate aminotransferase